MLFIFVVLFYMVLGHVASLVIPDDAIRIRVIANSNDAYDQEIKNKVKDRVQNQMYDLLKDVKGSNEARKIINDNLDSKKIDSKTNIDENNLDFYLYIVTFNTANYNFDNSKEELKNLNELLFPKVLEKV